MLTLHTIRKLINFTHAKHKMYLKKKNVTRNRCCTHARYMNNMCRMCVVVCRASSKITSSKLYFIVCDRFLTTVSLKNSWQQKFTHKNYYSYPSYAVERPSTTTLSAGGVKLNTEQAHNNRGMRQVWKRVRTAESMYV